MGRFWMHFEEEPTEIANIRSGVEMKEKIARELREEKR